MMCFVAELEHIGIISLNRTTEVSNTFDAELPFPLQSFVSLSSTGLTTEGEKVDVGRLVIKEVGFSYVSLRPATVSGSCPGDFQVCCSDGSGLSSCRHWRGRHWIRECATLFILYSLSCQ
jgi:hypothetical protein